ncbi:MAG: nucleotidyltransferase [Anaerolineae bacterium]|nr:nucleotidyltransferase [Anaerolineae bacterium]
MAKLNSLFDTFLSNINPDEEAVAFAIDAHESVRECLERQDKFRQYVEGSFLYGSYKRHTAVGDIKDVDIVILTNFDVEDKDNTPRKVLRKLKAALARCYDDPENPQYQRRSIRIDEPLPNNEDVEMTLDVIPAVIATDKDSPLRVPDHIVEEWIWTHPKGHLSNTTMLNSDDYSKGRFIPLVKMMKWWWKYQCEIRQPDVERPKPKGFWVECLTSENFDPNQTAWADHFMAVLGSVSEKYADIDEVPLLKDPGLEGEYIKTNMTMKEFLVFMEAINESLELAEQARNEENQLTSSELWREIFGDQFPLYDEVESEKTRAESRQTPLDDYSHAKPLRWKEIPDSHYKVQLNAYIYAGEKKLGGINSNGRTIQSGLGIKYVARVKAKGDYEVWWQVVNTGKHAEIEEGLRGDFFKAKLLNGGLSNNPLVNWEQTEYTGKHWIQCFIIRNRVCVSKSSRFYVNIKNPNFP